MNNQNFGGYLDYNQNFENDEGAFKFNSPNVRLGFIRKVYMILAAQLSLTAAFIGLSVASQAYRDFQTNEKWLIGICAIVVMITLYSLVCYRSVSRSFPINYVFLLLFTLSEAYLCSCITMEYDAKVVLLASVLTASMVLALTLYALTTKTDFTICGGLLFVCIMLLLVAGLLQFFIRDKVFETFVSVLVILVFSIYVIYDTQLIIGKKQNALEVDDYIIGALMLYLDIIRIFLEILKLLGKKERNS